MAQSRIQVLFFAFPNAILATCLTIILLNAHQRYSNFSLGTISASPVVRSSPPIVPTQLTESVWDPKVHAVQMTLIAAANLKASKPGRSCLEVLNVLHRMGVRDCFSRKK